MYFLALQPCAAGRKMNLKLQSRLQDRIFVSKTASFLLSCPLKLDHNLAVLKCQSSKVRYKFKYIKKFPFSVTVSESPLKKKAETSIH